MIDMETLEKKSKETKAKAGKKLGKEKKVSKTLEAARRLKGSIIVNDPALFL